MLKDCRDGVVARGASSVHHQVRGRGYEVSWWANVAPPVFARSRFLSGRASIKSALAGLGPSALEGWLGVTRGGTGKARACSYSLKMCT